MEYILETQDLTKVYGKKEAAKDINLHIAEGQIYGLIGRNGAGKTTIMRMISGLSSPTSGSYSLFGKTGYQKGKMLRNVGVLIEAPGIYPRLSAYENLKIKCIGTGVNPKGYVEKLLQDIGLENTDRKKPAGAYSLGMVLAVMFGLGTMGLLYSAIDTGLNALIKGASIAPYMPDTLLETVYNPATGTLQALRGFLSAAVTIGVFLPLSIHVFDRRDVK